MGKVFHRKLIRDNAPKKMHEAGVLFETRPLDEAGFKSELLRKVVEEAGELAVSETKDEIAGELADILDVLDQVREAFGVSEGELREARTRNAAEKGGFQQRYFLEWSEGGTYKKSTSGEF
jgi:predicted house-cleaning noncanonical NTP pyrophosphatase (MazG superfamily)